MSENIYRVRQELQCEFPDVKLVAALCRSVDERQLLGDAVIRRTLWPVLLGIHNVVGDADWDVLGYEDSLPQFPNQAELAKDAQRAVLVASEDERSVSTVSASQAAPSSPPPRSRDQVGAAAPSAPEPEPVFGIDDEESSSDQENYTDQPLRSPQSEPDEVLSEEIAMLLLARYCHSRGLRAYCRDVGHVLAPLLCLRLSASVTYACLYKLCEVLLPRLHNWAALQAQPEGVALLQAADARACRLLRRLVQLVDPDLIHHLDGVRSGWDAPARKQKASYSTVSSGAGCIPTAWLQLSFAGCLKPHMTLRLWTVMLTHSPSLQDIIRNTSASVAGDDDRARFGSVTVVAAVLCSQAARLKALQPAQTSSPRTPSSSGRTSPAFSGQNRYYDVVSNTLGASLAAVFRGDVSVSAVLRSVIGAWPAQLSHRCLPLAVFEDEISCLFRVGAGYAVTVTASKHMRKQHSGVVPQEPVPRPSRSAMLDNMLSALKPDIGTTSAAAKVGIASPRSTKHALKFAAMFACQLIVRTWTRAAHADLSMLFVDTDDSNDASSTMSSEQTSVSGSTDASKAFNWLAKAKASLLKPTPLPAQVTSSAYISVDAAGCTPAEPVPPVVPPRSVSAASGIVMVKSVRTSLPSAALPPAHAAPPPEPETVQVPQAQAVAATEASEGSSKPSLAAASAFLSKLTSRLSLDGKGVSKPGADTDVEPPRRTSLFSTLPWRSKAKDALPDAANVAEQPKLATAASNATVDSPPKIAFTIGSDDEASPTRTPAPAAAVASAESAAALLAFTLTGMKKGDEWNFNQWDSTSTVFKCRKIKQMVGYPEPLLLPRLIAITRDRIFVLEVHKFRMGVGIVKSNHSVAEVSAVVLRTTSKDTVGLKLRHSPKTSGEYTRTFKMEQPAEFLKAMREAAAAKTSTASSIIRKWF